MRLLSILPTVFLAALTYSGTSQQTPVKSLEPRDLTVDVQFLVDGLGATDFSLRSTISAFNTVSLRPPSPLLLIQTTRIRGRLF